MLFEPIYKTKISVSGGRNGLAISDDGQLKLQLVMPQALGGKETDPGTNPEQLFAACFGACFGGTLESIAKLQNIKLDNFSVQTTVTLGKVTGNGFNLMIYLELSAENPSTDILKELAEDAFAICTYSKAIRGNVDIIWKVKPLARNN